MAYTGSDIFKVTYANATIGSGTFYTKAGEGYTIDLGGQRSSDDKQNVTGGGTRINVATMSCSHFELPPIALDKTGVDELKKLNQLASAPTGSLVTVYCLDGAIYEMQNAYPVGDIAGDGYAGTIPCIFQGDAGASRIS